MSVSFGLDRISDGDEVELAFATIELRSICESRRRAAAALGMQAAKELAHRLADLTAIGTVAGMAGLFPEDIIERSPVERSIRMKADYDLVFCAGHVNVPKTSSGATDWARISKIRITAFEQANG